MKQFFSKFGALCIALIGLTCVVPLSACATKDVTTSTGSVEKVATFSTNELNLNTQAALFGIDTIAQIPKLKAYLAAHPDVSAKFAAGEAKLKDLSTQINAVTGGTVTVDIGKNWTNSVADELQTLLAIANPIVGALDPSAQQYVSLVSEAIPMIKALVATFGVPAPVVHTTPNSFGAAICMTGSCFTTPQALRERIYARY